tara:strand:+ start:103 stop:285 length:183 start_codon:yes stop_codon:yes gene_type:complete
MEDIETSIEEFLKDSNKMLKMAEDLTKEDVGENQLDKIKKFTKYFEEKYKPFLEDVDTEE